MDRAVKFEEAAARAAGAIRAQARRSERRPIASLRTAQRRRAGVTAAVMVGAAALLSFGALSLVGSGGSAPAVSQPPVTLAPPPASTTTTTAGPTVTTTASATAPSLAAWTIAHDPTWHRADSELMPDLTWDSLTLATFPIRAGGSRCAHMPENALRDLGPGDALMSVFFAGNVKANGAPWPEDGFGDTIFPAAQGPTDAGECSDRDDLEVHWAPWRYGSTDLHVLVVFGGEASDRTRSAAWAALSSLTSRDPAHEGGVCVVTVPQLPGFVPPDPYPPAPSPPEMAWFGTPALWAPLPVDGAFVPTKSVWWSEDFDIDAGEYRPDITVAHQRLDVSDPPIVYPGPGTNANTAEDGWFMIANAGLLDDSPGCWRITAEYRDASLSFVVLVP
jgi:hypothetical protein